MLKSLYDEPLSLFGKSRLERFLQRLGLQMTFKHRVLFWVILAWLPLLIFSIVGGIHSVQITFFDDFPIHIRLLIGITLLILGEKYVEDRLRYVVPILVERGMITEENSPKVERAIARVHFLSQNFAAEVLALLAAIAIVQSHELIELPQQIQSWKSAETSSAILAHSWYRGISLVIYHFILLRWLWRYFIWIFFLYRLSRAGLILQSHHPDRRAGLSFLLGRHAAFGIFFLVISIVFSANIAGMVLHGGMDLLSYRSLVLVYVGLVAILVLAPLLVFTPALVRIKRHGLRLYGRFASRHATDFEKRWAGTSMIAGGSPLGVQEISSNADLDTSYESLHQMRLILINRRYMVGLGCYVLLPFLPLALLKVPLFEILEKLAKMLI